MDRPSCVFVLVISIADADLRRLTGTGIHVLPFIGKSRDAKAAPRARNQSRFDWVEAMLDIGRFVGGCG
jgi:hypothetical protein